MSFTVASDAGLRHQSPRCSLADCQHGQIPLSLPCLSSSGAPHMQRLPLHSLSQSAMSFGRDWMVAPCLRSRPRYTALYIKPGLSSVRRSRMAALAWTSSDLHTPQSSIGRLGEVGAGSLHGTSRPGHCARGTVISGRWQSTRFKLTGRPGCAANAAFLVS